MIALLLLLAAGPPELDGVGLDPRPRALLPLDVPLTDAGGHTRALGAWLGGEPTLLVLAYYRCPALCGVVVREAAAAAGALPEPPRALVVSFDPEDTTATAREAGADLDWPFLVARPDGIDRLLDAVGMRVRRDAATGQLAHPAAVFVVSPSGHLAGVIEGPKPDPRRLAEALDAAREERFEGGVLGWVLSCFRWEPARRLARPGAERLLRAGGAAIFAGFALFLAVVAARGRR